MAENIVAAPHRTQRAQAGGVENLQRGQLRIDRLAAFHVQHGRELAVRHRRVDIGSCPADGPAAGALDPQGYGCHIQRRVQRRLALQRAGQGLCMVPVRVGYDWRGFSRRNVDGAKAAGQASGRRPLQVDVTAPVAAEAHTSGAIDEFRDGVHTLCRMFPQPGKNIIVAIEDELHQ